MHTRGRTALAIVFYGGLLVALAGALLQVWPLLLPSGLASQLGHNTEAYLLVIALGVWIQFVRPSLEAADRAWSVTGAVALGCLAVGVGLLASDWPSRFRTLNESFLALAVLVPYVTMRRRPSRGRAVALALAVLGVVVLAQPTQLGVDLAETFGMIMLAPLAFDVFDRGMLDPAATTSGRARLVWYGVLAVLPTSLSALEYRLAVGGLAGDLTRYGVRIHEAFISMLVLGLYFAVQLHRSGVGSQARHAVREPTLAG